MQKLNDAHRINININKDAKKPSKYYQQPLYKMAMIDYNVFTPKQNNVRTMMAAKYHTY
ncbi:hypothetical protein ACFWXM_29535 [Achromobacter xylosoxidans]|uniref:hypothetical protein n=1 Tax=Alcaligenes xylosoxydans xylosoxydans TaxID=85698 RepID=UPI0037662D41